MDFPRDQASEELIIQTHYVANGFSRPWPLTPHYWTAPAFCHNPLYYEDEYLDRYGYHFGSAQPFISGVDFLWTTATLPYRMGAYPCCECVYTLGKYRPGDCVPFQIECLPLSLRGALYEAAAIAGLAALGQ